MPDPVPLAPESMVIHGTLRVAVHPHVPDDAVTATEPLPASGPVVRGGVEIGELISTHGDTAFALIRLDRLEETQGDATAAQIPVALHKPAWLV